MTYGSHDAMEDARNKLKVSVANVVLAGLFAELPVGLASGCGRPPLEGGCTDVTFSTAAFSTAAFDPFPISATDVTSCKRYKGCPDRAPLVVCPLQNMGFNNEDGVNPGLITFLEMFSRPPLLTP